jgi:membrane protein required for colicin V production
MVASASFIGRLASGLSAGDWVDLACLALLLLCLLLGAIRGLSGLLAGIIGLLLAIVGSFWLHPPLSRLLLAAPWLREHVRAGVALSYMAAVVVILLAYLLLRLLLHRFFKLIVEQPADRIFGMLAGLAQWLLLMVILFSPAALLPAGGPVQRALGEQSRIGRLCVPVLRDAYAARAPAPAAAAGRQDASRGKPAAQPDRKERGKDGK